MSFPDMFPAIPYPTVFFGKYTIPDSIKPFGTYIQKPIEWYVLEQDLRRGRALLLSRHVLYWEGFADCPIIFGHGFKTSWAKSYLKVWLNDDFYHESFTPEEQKRIITVNHAASNINDPGTVEDVFLLSAEEVREYFPEAGTAITLQPMVESDPSVCGSQKDPIQLDYEPVFWWTRTPGAEEHLVVCVDWNGELCEMDSNSDEVGVRPAMWVRL